MDETHLVERARGGDVDAYEALVRQFSDIAFRTAYLITADAAEAEDVAQDAFTKAYFALHRFRPDAPFRPWLLRIVANEARNRRKSAHRRTRLALRVAELRDSDAVELSPEASIVAAEQQQMILNALGSLREEDRLTIAYRYFLDLSESEMAEVLGCARGTVKSRLSRALGRLRERLRDSADAELGTSGNLRGVVDG